MELLLKNIMYKKIYLIFLFSIYGYSTDISQYVAKYEFSSEEITIVGTRKFSQLSNSYEMEFKASNLIANMLFSSKFRIDNNQVLSDSYKIKIRPKFLNRDQSIEFDYSNKIIKSTGQTVWSEGFLSDSFVVDPLNAQIMIRKFAKDGTKKFNLNVINMQRGGFKEYTYQLKSQQNCNFNKQLLNCVHIQRTRNDSKRIVNYFLAEELDFMFIKIIDSSPARTNTLSLKEILSFG